ncbi:MAG: CHASE2 domain-containing protein [Microscillaceae bacterium]|nr:CHASE2 domain-containing protein [Microscillaceae bacterium]MDW8461783.1 CHASE2 domain-containing protein [Cytophagales bacterium]
MRSLVRDSLAITVILFILLWLFSNIPFKFNILDPIQNAFEDFDLTDMVFSHFRDSEKEKVDTNIVLVNIGELDRLSVAAMLNAINQHQPKIVAIDAFYRKDKDPVGDSILMEAFKNTKNLVLVSKIDKCKEETGICDTLETSHPKFVQYAHTGHANLITKGEGNLTGWWTCRSFSPKEKVRDKNGKIRIEPAFAVKIAELAAPEKAKRFLARNNPVEWINFKGDAEPTDNAPTFFSVLDHDQVLDSSFAITGKPLIKDKIVMMGYMGKSLQVKDFTDKFYTPLNPIYVGRATPDMFGLVIHANIVSMILNEDYIDDAPFIVNFLIALVLVFITIYTFSYLFKHAGFWYDGITVVIQLFLSIILLALVVFTFNWYQIKIDVTAAVGGVVLAGLTVEIYHGLLSKFVDDVRKKRMAKRLQKIQSSIDAMLANEENTSEGQPNPSN